MSATRAGPPPRPVAAVVGAGRAYAGVTILNATATGRGCSLAVEAGVQARWAWGGDRFAWDTPDRDDRVARAVHDILCQRFRASAGATASTRTALPPGRGLKTSSAAAAALVRAATATMHVADEEVERLAVAACRRAGVTITGALDDQVAALRGGCHLTDNLAGRVMQVVPVPRWHVAVWVPLHAIAKADVAKVPAGAIAREVRAAERLLAAGDVSGAMMRNGAAFHRLYAAAGLPVSDAPVHAALEAGALAAGLSGTGPAIAALFAHPVDLPPVPGGSWLWTRVATEAP